MVFPDHKVDPYLPQKLPDLNWQKSSKIIEKTSLYALAEVPSTSTSATNHSLFIKWSQAKILGIKVVFQDYRVVPWPQTRPNLAKKRQISPKNSAVCSDGGSDSCYIDDQQSGVHQMVLSQDFRDQEGVSRPLSGSLSTKTT